MDYPVKVLGFGDNVVDLYDHLHLMYPGGNAVNFAVFAKRLDVARSAYMGIFGTDRAAEHVISSLEKEQVELVKCLQIPGENGWSRNTVVDGDRVFLDYNNGGIRGDVRYPLAGLSWPMRSSLTWCTPAFTALPSGSCPNYRRRACR